MGQVMTDEETVLGLNTQWSEAYPARDIMTLEKILADDWMCIDGSGEVIGKNDLLERVRLSPGFLEDHSFDETKLKMLDSAAVITGRLSGVMSDEDGRRNLVQRFTRVFAKRDGEWHAVAAQVTIVEQTKV
jgi:ketosteroid isomerase-like protein